MGSNVLKNNIPDKRNYGIDLLKIVSMIMIVICHIIGQGGVLEATSSSVVKHNVVIFMELWVTCCVNCYALISGYVGYSNKFRFSNIINLYLNVIFYTLGLEVAYSILTRDFIGFDSLIRALLPVGNDTYWYFTAYFCMFFFIPILKLIVEKTDKKQSFLIFVNILILFSAYTFIINRDAFGLKFGYSVFWLCSLYVVGAYLKKYDIANKIKKSTLITSYILLVFISFVVYIVLKYLKGVYNFEYFNIGLDNYCSPFTLLISIVLVLLFSSFTFNKMTVKIIKFFAPLSFSVYLIHVNPIIFDGFLKDAFVPLADANIFIMAAAIILFAIVIWFVCSMVDLVRFYLFKFLKIKKLSKKISEMIIHIFNNIFKTVSVKFLS